MGKARTQKVDIYFNYVGQVDIAYTEEELAEIKAQEEQIEMERLAKQREREISVGSLHLRIKEMKCLISTVFAFSSVSSFSISSIFVSSSACSSSYCFISCLYCLSGSNPETRFSYKPRISLDN